MRRRLARQNRALTLLEVLLVVGLLALLAALAVPNFLDELRREELPGSAKQLRSLVSLVSANAAFDGKRYRIRFPEEGENDPLGGNRQPLIEREDDPIRDPEGFRLVTAPWAVGRTFLGEAWCAEVRLGRPTIERLRKGRDAIKDAIDKSMKEFDPGRPPLVIDPDASSEWATFVLTNAPRNVPFESLADYPRIELILEGATGLSWLQRPFYDEELDLFGEHNWPVVLRQDFLQPRVLTENDVLELREANVQR